MDKRHGERRPEAGARRHAEQVRIGERVLEDPLIRGAGDREASRRRSRRGRPGALAAARRSRYQAPRCGGARRGASRRARRTPLPVKGRPDRRGQRGSRRRGRERPRRHRNDVVPRAGRVRHRGCPAAAVGQAASRRSYSHRSFSMSWARITTRGPRARGDVIVQTEDVSSFDPVIMTPNPGRFSTVFSDW